MAEINTKGLEELSYDFMRQEENATNTVREMVQAEAEIYTEQLKQAIAGYGIKNTGGFLNSIKAGEIQQEDTAVYITIQAEGRANHTADYGGGYSNKGEKRKGKSSAGNVRYAAIGFIFEYGTSSIPARPWWTKGNQQAEEPAYNKAMEIWEQYVKNSF